MKPVDIDFNNSPYLVIWETTRSCALKCLHCRAEAIDRRDPNELSFMEACRLMDQIRLFGKPLVVLTGGDPLRRPDLADIVAYGTRLGLSMAVTPSGTREVSWEKLQQLKDSGLARLAVSLDGSTAAIHDAFRRVNGSYDSTIQILRWANELGVPIQINTTITRHNIDDMDALCELMGRLKIVLWSVFFLVPVGRGQVQDEVSADDYERVFHKMAELAEKCSFDIKSTAAPHYRRVLMQRKAGGSRLVGVFNRPDRAPRGVNDANGFVFISHTGQIMPSGFLPLAAGDVRKDSLVEVYRDSPLFKRLRDHSQLKGKCGACEFKTVCGGSRARAYAVYGDEMREDPYCAYIPKKAAVSLA